MEKFKLFDAEFKFIQLIWKHEPLNSTELSKISEIELGWKKSTTYNMIRKLAERGILKNEQATVTTLIKREQIQQYESESLMEKAFDNSLPSFVAAFLKNKKLSRQEAEEIKKMIEGATK